MKIVLDNIKKSPLINLGGSYKIWSATQKYYYTENLASEDQNRTKDRTALFKDEATIPIQQ